MDTKAAYWVLQKLVEVHTARHIHQQRSIVVGSFDLLIRGIGYLHVETIGRAGEGCQGQ